MTYDEAIRRLKESPNNLRCKEVTGILSGLGFDVDTGRAGHRTYLHRKIKDFEGGNFNCGHGRDGFVKEAYVRMIRKVLECYEEELREMLK